MKNFIQKILRENLIKEYYDDEDDYDDEDGEKYFNTTIDDDVKRNSSKYTGRYVDWYGNPDEMIYIHKNYVDGQFGNIYDDKKLNFLTKLIRNHDENIEIETSYGHGDVIRIQDIIEQQEAYKDGRFSTDYDGQDEPMSIGDDDLDDYLGSDTLEDAEVIYSFPDEVDIYEYANDNRFSIINGKTSGEFLAGMFNQLGINESNLTEADKEFLSEFFEAEKRVLDNIENGHGDINSFRVQLRDGHHRVNAAINAGEDYVALDLGDNGISKYGEYIKNLPYVGRVTNN
jgi:hypothetical protein